MSIAADMLTLTNPKRKRASSGSTSTSLPSIFDDSPLSSALTIESDFECHSSPSRGTPWKRCKSSSPAQQNQHETEGAEIDAEIVVPAIVEAYKNDYASAALFRPRRGCTLPPDLRTVAVHQHATIDVRPVPTPAQPRSASLPIDIHDVASLDEVSTTELQTEVALVSDNGHQSDAHAESNIANSEAGRSKQSLMRRHDQSPIDPPEGPVQVHDEDEEIVGTNSEEIDAPLPSSPAVSDFLPDAESPTATAKDEGYVTRRITRSSTKAKNVQAQNTVKKTSQKPARRSQTAKPKSTPRAPNGKGQTKKVTKPRTKKVVAPSAKKKSLIVQFKYGGGQEEVRHQSGPVENHELYPIVQKLFANRTSNGKKPPPVAQPAVWADGRQELCETLHYYRSYQSACYSANGSARSFMFDKNANARDYMDENVIISRAGGGLLKDKDSGEMRTSKDQTGDSTVVQGLRNCMRQYNPVIIITGSDNPHMPSQPPHQYSVLDHFKPTHVWFEKGGGKRILRYRFEKLNPQKPSWWQPAGVEETVELGSLDPPVERTCNTCNVVSLQVYLNGWMCLQPNCAAFWLLSDGLSGRRDIRSEPNEESLVYDPRFLKQRVPWPNDEHDYPLIPNAPELSGYCIPGEDTSQAFWLGLVCPDCGRCNSRLNWMAWKCANPTCSFKKEPPHTLIPASSLREPFWPLTDSYTPSRDTYSSLIRVDVTFAHGYRINRYTIPGINGFVTHMIANRTVVSEIGGPDTMFEELQQTDIDLRRRPMPNGQLKGDTHCRHFSVNYGMPYKFIAATASHSFSGAARPITATRSQLNWAAKYLLVSQPGADSAAIEETWAAHEFNEVLALGYFEAQKINYHDDGEFGLGPTIATLSLGAPGTMRIRMKARNYHGVTSTTYDDSLPLPGCQAYAERLALAPGLASLKDTDKAAYRARLKEIPKELNLKGSGNAKDVLKMELGHGDIVVMHGAEIQRYYEHAVEHGGKLRFALTCRYIDPESLKEADRPDYVVERDEGAYDGSKLC